MPLTVRVNRLALVDALALREPLQVLLDAERLVIAISSSSAVCL
jgi:hypothetical protein